jgi:hypothetical protein
MLAQVETKAQVPLADRNGKPEKSNGSDAHVAKSKKELIFAQKDIAKLKIQLHQSKENLAKERAERGSKGKKEGSQDDEIGSKRLWQQAKQAKASKQEPSPPTPSRKGFKVIPTDAMHTKYPLEPIKIYATKTKIDEYRNRLSLICITEAGESQAMMEMVKNTYLTNLHDISTNIERMHMDPESWYQQHTLDSDSDAHHVNRHMIDIVQKYLRGDATRMETYIEPVALVYEHKHCKGIFALSKLTLDATRSIHAAVLVYMICQTHTSYRYISTLFKSDNHGAGEGQT